MGLIGNFLKAKAVAAYVSDAKRVVELYQSLGPLECTDAKVAAAVALAFMFEDGEHQHPNPARKVVAAVFGASGMDDAEAGELSAYTLRLIRLQQEAYRGQHAVNKLIASGIPTWIISIRASHTSEIVPYARALWAVLGRADQGMFLERLIAVSDSLTGMPSLADAVARMQTLKAPPQFLPK